MEPEMIEGLIDSLNGLPLWALAGAVVVVVALEASLLTGVVLLAAVALGSVVGETIGFAIGRRYGGRIQASRVGRWVGPERWVRGADYLARRGSRAVFVGRFLAALHAILPIVAGSVGMRYRRFIAAAAAGALAWSALYLTIGGLAGASYRFVAEQLSVASGIVVGGLIGAALFSGVMLIRKGLTRVSPRLIDIGIVLSLAGIVSFGITIAREPGARSPDALAFAIGIASAAMLIAHRRWPVHVLGGTLIATLAFMALGYPAGPTNLPVWVALFSTAASGRLMLALVAGGAFTGVGIAYRLLVEHDRLGDEVITSAALFVTLALLGDALRRRARERQDARPDRAAGDRRSSPAGASRG